MDNFLRYPAHGTTSSNFILQGEVSTSIIIVHKNCN